MSWTSQQDHALSDISKWLADPSGQRIFRLFGFAGSGKTTLAKHIAAGVSGSVHFAAFTGKASLVLRKKGCSNASTIHSLIYRATQNEQTGEAEFTLNHDSPVRGAGLIIVDESSTINEQLALDLLSFGTRVLVLGDPAQLPPVKGEGYFINAKPDVMLTEIHRQAQDNPIIQMSMDVRENRGLQPGRYGDSMVIRRSRLSNDDLHELILDAEQVLVGTNKSRQAINAHIRETKGLPENVPTIGDRLVCLKNNSDKQLLNGELWDVTQVEKGVRSFNMNVVSVDDPDRSPVRIRVPFPFFEGTEKDMFWRDKLHFDEFTYGWALTVHKSQGSEWESVCVIDESSCFREHASKHLYTAVTRASERITVLI